MTFLPIQLSNVAPVTPNYPPGDYLFEVTGVEVKQLDSGVSQLKIKNAILAGPDGMQGKTFTDSFLLTENAAGFLAAFIQALGLQGAHVDQAGPEVLVGRQFVANLHSKKAKDGNEYDNLRKYRPAGAWTHGGVAGAPVPAAAQPSMFQQLPVAQAPVAAPAPVYQQAPVAAPQAVAPVGYAPAPAVAPVVPQQAYTQPPVQQAPAGFPAPPPPPGTVPQR